MPLSQSQLTTLRAFVAASSIPAIVSARASGSTFELQKALNDVASPVTKAWDQNVSRATLFDAMNITAYDTLSAGKRDAWALMMDNAPLDFAKNAIRKAVTDIWGTAADAQAILNAATENATVAQVAIGGSTATTATVAALKRDFDGVVSDADSVAILAP